jgi:hypothetical protein
MSIPNPDPTPRKPFEDRLRDAASHVEQDLRRVVTYLNDEVVPDVRRNSSEALRAAASELHKLAGRVDRANHPTPPAPPKA